MNLIQEIVLQHGRSSPYKRIMENPTITIGIENPLCGDSLKIDIKITEGKITDICFVGDGCLISQAAASLLLDKVKKVKKIDKIKEFDRDTIVNLLGFHPTPSRIKCAVLSLEALQKALINY